MAIVAPFDGVLVRMTMRRVPRLRRQWRTAKALGIVPDVARMVVYRGGYVALEIDEQTLRTILRMGFNLKNAS